MNLGCRFHLLICVILSGLAVLALATGQARDIMKSLDDFESKLTSAAEKRARETGTKVDFEAIYVQVLAKTKEAVKGIDPAKVNPSEALDWATLFMRADKNKEAQIVLTRFIHGKPANPKLFQAQEMLLSAAAMNEDAKAVTATLKALKPYDPATTIAWGSLHSRYLPELTGQLGIEGAQARADAALREVGKLTSDSKLGSRASSVQSALFKIKADIYTDAGKRDLALKVLDTAIAKVAPANKNQFVTMKNQISLVGSIAPTLTRQRGYGDFPGLAALKGKVVILDFFAHWCGPCKAAFPDMRQMYADLKPQGLELVGVTSFYGYYDDPSVKLKPDEEFAKMEGFIKDLDMTWPVVFCGRADHTAYGVTAIPHVVVIDRQGVVRKLEIGYTPETFKSFRREIEALLAAG